MPKKSKKKIKAAEKLPPYQSTMERFPDHVKAIGMITVELANVEVMLAQLLGALLDRNTPIAEAIYFAPRATIARVAIVDDVM
jgi:hypothetical protein